MGEQGIGKQDPPQHRPGESPSLEAQQDVEVGAPGLADGPPGDPIARAAEYGIDISLIRSNLQCTVTKRLNTLDANAAFVRGVRRRKLQ